jgi:DNA-binding protein HU-beta
MNKHDLVMALSERLSLTQTQSLAIVNAWEGVLLDALLADKRLMLQGFGTFFAWNQTERMGRNPRTGESCPIEARISVKFKPGKFLLKALNEKKNDSESIKGNNDEHSE